jgi:hypothetical protein
MHAAGSAIGGLLLLAAAQRDPAVPGLVASWSFEEGHGTSAADTVRGYEAVFSGAPAWTAEAAPVRGSTCALELDPARRDHLRVRRPGLPTPQEDFTVELWMRPRSDPATWLRAVAFLHDGNGFQLCYGLGGNVAFAVWRNGERVQVRNSAHPKNEWIHVAGVWEAATGTARLFLNGREVGDNAGGSALGVDTGGDLLIGTRGDDQGYFDGMLDEIRIWNYARTPGHIRAYFGQRIEAGPQG